jgi:hypothetical protein
MLDITCRLRPPMKEEDKIKPVVSPQIYLRMNISVPDHGSRVRDVVLVRCIICLGKPRGSGIWNGEGMGREWGENGEGEVSLQATWGQGGRDRITPKEGFQVSKR